MSTSRIIPALLASAILFSAGGAAFAADVNAANTKATAEVTKVQNEQKTVKKESHKKHHAKKHEEVKKGTAAKTPTKVDTTTKAKDEKKAY